MPVIAGIDWTDPVAGAVMAARIHPTGEPMTATAPRRPVFVPQVLEDRDVVGQLIEANAPYLPTQRYFANTAEYQALSGDDEVAQMPVTSLFRGDWAYDEPLVDGIEPFLHNPAFVAAARDLFGGTVVRPQIVYANITYQLPVAQGVGHTDIPAFRGFDRTEHPIVFLSIMGHSRLFEDARLRIATAVSWFHRGTDGGFEYWPDGPDRPSAIHQGDIDNTAVVADNDLMFHRALGVGRLEDGMVGGMTLDSRLERDGDGWVIRDDGTVLARPASEDFRISVSWKGLVFADQDEADSYDAGEGRIDLDEVLSRFAADLEARGVDVTIPATDPERDPDFIRTLQETYVREPAAELV